MAKKKNDSRTGTPRRKYSARPSSSDGKDRVIDGSFESASPPPATAFQLRDADFERALLAGEDSGALSDYLGPELYAEARSLAQQAAARSVRGGDRILIVPGIMGSKLGHHRFLLDDVIWLDPLSIMRGRLSELVMGAGPAIEPVGVLLFTYLTLKLRLRIAGFDADFYPYDWRASLDDLGRDLAAAIDSDGRQTKIVAHSMGGLVSRAAFGHAPEKLQRVVMLGTPNFGSYAPVQAFRGANGTIEQVARLDLTHNSAELARIFSGFPGLLQMIPLPPAANGRDLFDLYNWPATGERPDATILRQAKAVQEALPQSMGGTDIVLIAGVNQRTVVDARVDNDEFVYTYSNDGDGTVPLRCCLIPSAKKTYYVEELHGSLPGNAAIQAALPSILSTGATERLSATVPQQRGRAVPVEVSESQLAASAVRHTRALPGAAEQRLLASEFVAPATPLPLALSLPGSDVALGIEADEPLADALVIGRGRPVRLEITLAQGSITAADAECYVLPLFKAVEPGGAANAVDALMDGAVIELVQRRMLNGNVGEIDILPCGRHPIRAETVAFAGLGSIGGFETKTLEVVGENLIRTLVAARVDDFATVPFGVGSGQDPMTAIRSLLRGFLRGLKDADKKQRFRRLTICEIDPGRYDAIRKGMYSLIGTTLFDGVEVTYSATTLSTPVQPATRSAASITGERVYLIVREAAQRLNSHDSVAPLTASVLTPAGSKAAIISGVQPAPWADINAQLEKLPSLLTAASVDDFGAQLGRLVLADDVIAAVKRYPDTHLVVVHDALASRIPWETLRFGSTSPALAGGLSHRYEAANLSVAKWLEDRRQSLRLNILVVADPRGDLPAAAAEGDRIEEMAGKNSGMSCRVLRGNQARKSELLVCFSSGEFDVVHYAGHAFFDPVQRGRSGLGCADDEILSGDDLSTIGNLPALMFFNACEAARIRSFSPTGTGAQTKRATHVRSVGGGVGFAESILRGGVANFIGTYWPVGDVSAGTFAESFYAGILCGQSLNVAVLAARKALVAAKSQDWADYVFYGDAEFVLKPGRAK